MIRIGGKVLADAKTYNSLRQENARLTGKLTQAQYDLDDLRAAHNKNLEAVFQRDILKNTLLRLAGSCQEASREIQENEADPAVKLHILQKYLERTAHSLEVFFSADTAAVQKGDGNHGGSTGETQRIHHQDDLGTGKVPGTVPG